VLSYDDQVASDLRESFEHRGPSMPKEDIDALVAYLSSLN